MSLSDNQRVNAAVTNAAFLSKKTDSTTVALLGLNKPSEGAQVLSAQKAINKAFEGIGTTGETDATINNYANQNYITNGDNRKVAIGKLDAQFHWSHPCNTLRDHQHHFRLRFSKRMEISSSITR